MEELCLMSGLRCVENGDYTNYQLKNCYSKEQYFNEAFLQKNVEKTFRSLSIDTVDKDVDIGII